MDVSGGLRPRGDVVGVEADDVPQGAVALEGEELLVVVHVENRLHRVHHPPGDGDADLHGVAQAVVDLLPGVAQGHDFQGDLFARCLLGLARGRPCQGGQETAAALGGLNVRALVHLGFGGGVHGHAEGVDVVEPLPLQGAHILAEEGEHQGLLRGQHLQPQKEDPAQAEVDDAHHHGGHHGFHGEEDGADHRQDIQDQGQQKHEHAVFLVGKDGFCHRNLLLTFYLISK